MAFQAPLTVSLNLNRSRSVTGRNVDVLSELSVSRFCTFALFVLMILVYGMFGVAVIYLKIPKSMSADPGDIPSLSPS